MVPLYDRTNTVNRDQNQVGFIWKYILIDGNLPELCGIYDRSAWKRGTVPLNDGRNIISRGQNQVGFTWKYILNDGNLPELCGIYE